MKTLGPQFLPKSSRVNVPNFVHIAFLIQAVVALLSVCPVLADFFFCYIVIFLRLFFYAIVTAVYCCIPICREYSEGTSNSICQYAIPTHWKFCVRISCALI